MERCQNGAVPKYSEPVLAGNVQIDNSRIHQPENANLEFVNVDSGLLGKIGTELRHLTEEQYEALDLAEYNARVLIRGAAGTGKTTLAIELARRRAPHDRVALLCHSTNMRDWLKLQGLPQSVVIEWLSPEMLIKTLFGDDPVRLNRYILKNDRLAGEFRGIQSVSGSGPNDPLQISHSTLCQDAWSAFVDEVVSDYTSTGGTAPFDYLILDEAQCFATEHNLKMMDALLQDGISGGRWTVFGDLANKHISAGSSAMDFRQELERRYPHSRTNAPLLRINCRNALPIAEAVARLAADRSYKPDIRFKVYGPGVKMIYFEGASAAAGDILDSEVEQLRKGNVLPKQIVVVSSLPLEDLTESGLLDTDREYGGLKLNDVSTAYSKLSDTQLNYSFYTAFLGLESDVVILLLAASIGGEDEAQRRVLYTTISRAKAHLVIISDESNRDALEIVLPR